MSYTTLIISLGSIILYLFTGNKLIDDEILLAVSIFGFIVTFILALKTKKVLLMKMVRFILIGFLLYYLVMDFFWNQP
jgi:hypothetical protein